MKYKLGKHINIYDEEVRDVYADHCIDFITLHNELKIGDKIWLIRDGHLVEVDFLGFIRCMWAKKSNNTISCRTCKGYLQIKTFFGDIKKQCAGYSHKRNSNVYKICKNILLEDDLFEI